MSRIKYLVQRAAVSVVLIFLAVSALFFLFRSMPGDYTTLFAQRGASAETVARLEQKWGLADPLHVQYQSYMANMLTGDAGTSFRYGIDVWDLTKWRLLNSVILIAPAITIAYIGGSAIGGVLGNSRGRLKEKVGIVGIMFIGALPAFFTAILLITVFAEMLDLFPTSGIVSIDTARVLGQDSTPLDTYQTRSFWWHYTLPFSAIVIRYLYVPTLIMRTNVVEVSNQGFMNYHRLTGISFRREVGKLIKHSSLPVITLYPVSMTRALGGMVLIEVVFNWPGIGQLLVGSVLERDFPVVQFVFMLIIVWVVIANFVVDIVYGVIDPRVAVGED